MYFNATFKMTLRPWTCNQQISMMLAVFLLKWKNSKLFQVRKSLNWVRSCTNKLINNKPFSLNKGMCLNSSSSFGRDLWVWSRVVALKNMKSINSNKVMYLVIRHVSTILPHCTLTWPTLNQIYCISMHMIYANMWVRRICLNTSIQFNNIQTWIRYAKCNRRICSGNNTKSKLCRIHWMINKIVGDSIDVWDYLNYA